MGGFKLDQLLADCHHAGLIQTAWLDPAPGASSLRHIHFTIHSSLVRHVQEANALLIAGYGFGDLHVNRSLRNRFDRPDDDAAHPKAVVLEKSPQRRLQTASLQIYDYWAYQMTHTLNTRFSMTEAHRNGELTVAPFLENGEFETDNHDRVAIWHGGFREALSDVGRINDWLSRTG